MFPHIFSIYEPDDNLYQDIIRVAFENGINMIDTAEAYAKGESELAMYACIIVGFAMILTSDCR